MDVRPCEPWPAVWCCDLTGYSPAATGNALEAATEVLWALSGRQFGECVLEDLRPCREECGIYSNYGRPEWSGWGWPYPDLIAGQWYNLGCGGGCDGGCSCNTVEQFILPMKVTRIVDIVIDGQIVPTGSYRLDNHRFVVRTDGGGWPHCNDLSVSFGPGSWSVTVVVGEPVPKLGQLAVGELACELAKLCNDEECVLPTNARRVTRQGVTVDTPDVKAVIETGALGLQFVELFIASYNPSRLAYASTSRSPDRPPLRYPT